MHLIIERCDLVEEARDIDHALLAWRHHTLHRPDFEHGVLANHKRLEVRL